MYGGFNRDCYKLNAFLRSVTGTWGRVEERILMIGFGISGQRQINWTIIRSWDYMCGCN